MSPTQCPVCGSVEVDASENQQEIRVPFGPNARVSRVVNTCRVCGESGDFSGANDERVKLALTESVRLSVPRMLEQLGALGMSMAYIERSLDLPARTSARWKAGEHSAAAVALLRIVATFPWVLQVAESGFDQFVAHKAVVAASASVLHSYVSANNLCVAVMSAPATLPIVIAIDAAPEQRKQVQHATVGVPSFSLGS